MTKVFILGATGYIAGTVIEQLAVEYPDLDITIIARTAAKAGLITAKYPRIHVVIGDLESSAIIEEQSALADIVFNSSSSDHEESVRAIIRGLEKRGGGYFIHTSGIAMLWDTPNGSVLNDKIWDDVADLGELRSFPIEAVHRNVEKIVLDAPASVRVALVSPGGVYGVGTGAVSKSSMPIMTSAIVHHGSGFTIGTGVSTMSHVHVLDVARLFVLLIGEALKPNGGVADWGEQGYYYAVSNDAMVKDQVRTMADELAKLGHIKSNEVEVLSIEEAQKIHPFVPYLFAANTRAVASRARKLGWKPVEQSVLESLVTDLKVLNPRGHAFNYWVGLGL
ncbi:hypothetical protein Q9L58_009492 [Maublancomyces gigas]|uniref:NAD(P)-binding domain-containing protein n=1 Tax=Discina gigas TaxID=1032678 RepID=A0ABR3G754_9PEZI